MSHLNAIEPLKLAKQPTPKRFVVLTMQRSGSTWFIDLLNSADGVRAFGEIFLNVAATRHQKSWNKHLLPDLRYYDFVENSPTRRFGSAIKYLNYLYGSVSGQQAVGFKLMWSQLREHKEIVPYLLAKRFSIIYLERENSLEQVLSWNIAKSRRVYHSIGQIESKPVRIESGRVLEQVKKLESRKNTVRMILKYSPIPVITISYEDLRRDPPGMVDVIADFLCVPRSAGDVESQFKKVLGDTLYNQIENASELRSLFEREGLGRFFAGGDGP